MLVHIASSLKTVLSGYLLGVVIGIPLGICMAWFKPVDRFLRPLFDLIKPIPGIAWIPVMITLFGIGLLGKAMIVFMTAFIACMVNAYSGIKQTRDVHLWVAQTFGASNLQQLFTVAIPTALPMIMTGLRVALGAAWSAVIAAELLASSSGIGFMIQQCRGLARPDIIIAGMIAIGLIGTLLTWLLGLLETASDETDEKRTHPERGLRRHLDPGISGTVAAGDHVFSFGRADPLPYRSGAVSVHRG